MKKQFLLSLATATALSTSLFADTKSDIAELKEKVADLEAYIEEVEGTLEKAETKILVDKIKLGLGMRVEANNIETTYANGTKPQNEDTVFRTKLNINMKSDIADNLKFSGRLSSYKNWGDSNEDAMLMANMDAKQGRTPDNTSALYVERAYLDWKMTDGDYPLYLTIGRQPSSDGPSYQIKEGSTRKGTYDALAFDGAADGIVLTANLNKLMPGTTSFRIAHGTPNNGSTYNSAMKDTKVTGLFLDKTCAGIKQDHLIQLYTVTAKDLMGNPTAGTNDTNLGDLNLVGGMFEIQKVNGFDFFAHFAASKAKPNGQYLPYDMNGDGNIVAGEGAGLLSTNGMGYGDKSGNAIWLGTQYSMSEWSFGAEYNKGSKNWFSFTFAPNDPINKLATRGTATELYVSKKINKYSNVRLGHVNIEYDYTGSGSWLGSAMAMNSAFGTGAVKEKTNTYLTFNVLF